MGPSIGATSMAFLICDPSTRKQHLLSQYAPLIKKMLWKTGIHKLMDCCPKLLLSMKTIALINESFQTLMMLTNAVDEYILPTKPMMTWMNPLLLLLLSKTNRMLLCYLCNLLRGKLSNKLNIRVSINKSNIRASIKKSNRKHQFGVSYRKNKTTNRKHQFRMSQNSKHLVMDNNNESQTCKFGMVMILFQNADQGLSTAIKQQQSVS
jgi:hypothetical protein